MGIDVVSLRRMTESDVPAAAAMEAVVYPQPWSEQVFLDELTAPNRTYFLAEESGTVVGYAGVMLVGDEAHVTTVVVAPDHRTDRVGTRLMLALTESAIDAGARSMTLEVRVSNQPAQALYRRFGMAPVGVRKNYYRTEDAYIYWVHDVDGPEYTARLAAIRQQLMEPGER